LTLESASSIPENPEGPRDAKGWVGRELMGGVVYKPTVHQLPLVKALRVAELRASGLSSFRRLESAVNFLGEQTLTDAAGVYPEVLT
jgi:hypothetical protein